MLSFFRVIRFACQDIIRNMSLSFMTVLILLLMLLSVNTLLVIRVLTDEATSSIKNEIDVSIYFIPDVSDQIIQEVRAYIDSFPEVTQSTLLDRDDVLKKFQEEHSDNPDILSALEELGTNPLGAALIVKTREPGDYKKIIEAISVPEYETLIEAKTFDDTEKAIERIDVITTQVERFSLILSIFFGIIAFLIIFNTIRIIIYTQRNEITIKKLVGATNWFIRGPYLVEAFLFSIISVGVTYALVLSAAHVIDPFAATIFGKHDVLTSYFQSGIVWLAGSQFLTVLLLTTITSLLAMRKHLRA